MRGTPLEIMLADNLESVCLKECLFTLGFCKLQPAAYCGEHMRYARHVLELELLQLVIAEHP